MAVNVLSQTPSLPSSLILHRPKLSDTGMRISVESECRVRVTSRSECIRRHRRSTSRTEAVAVLTEQIIQKVLHIRFGCLNSWRVRDERRGSD